MPTRNLIKQYARDRYYHIYSRGVAKQPIFCAPADYEFFLSLFKRYLSNAPAKSAARVPYPWFGAELELLSYCLMPNHVHLLIYQKNNEFAMASFMRALMTSYSMYFNRKYKRVGPVFQSRYLASDIDRDDYLEHISRYLHLNPHDWQNYNYSSLQYYLANKRAAWIKPERILAMFKDKKEYEIFLKDYKEQKQILDELKLELAHE